MNRGKYVFAQICALLPQRTFRRYVEKYGGDKHIKSFSCYHQLLCMIFGQLSSRDSLRDLTTCLSAHNCKFYQLGLGKSVSRSNLAYANENRDYRMFEDFAYALVDYARHLHVPDPEVCVGLPAKRLYSFDSTVVDLCLEVFCWATFRQTKAAIKVHTLFDVRATLPAFIYVTEGSVHDVKALDVLAIEADAFYIMDRAYVDYKRLWRIADNRAWFVVRAKSNMRFRRIDSDTIDRNGSIICDQVIVLTSTHARNAYPGELRRVKYYDEENDLLLVFLTNNFDITAEQVALLYKHRWSVETFFKWVKQHLRVLSFWGTTQNAVKTQVYIAMITFILISILKSTLKSEMSLNDILQVVSVSLLDKTPLEILLKDYSGMDNTDNLQIQLDFAENI